MSAEEQELELANLEAEQGQLEEQVALFELERETTKTDVARFQKRYYDTVGRFLVELDKLLAGISQQVAAANPENIEAQNEASVAQERARQSAEEAGLIESQPEANKLNFPSVILRLAISCNNFADNSPRGLSPSASASITAVMS